MSLSIVDKIVDLVFPRYCPVCGNRLDIDERPICIDCNLRLPRTDNFLHPTDNAFAQSLYGKAHCERVAAFFRFIPHSDAAGIIYDAKYHGKDVYAEQMGYMMAQEASLHGFFEGIDAIVPVPITARRRWHRGFNQSESIAQGIRKVTGLPIISNALLRTDFSESQTKLDAYERKANVEKAFLLVDPAAVSHKHVLLVDDIATTGATLVACANQLEQAAGCVISILTIGKTSSR